VLVPPASGLPGDLQAAVRTRVAVTRARADNLVVARPQRRESSCGFPSVFLKSGGFNSFPEFRTLSGTSLHRL
jgi:hypothetical protein